MTKKSLSKIRQAEQVGDEVSLFQIEIVRMKNMNIKKLNIKSFNAKNSIINAIIVGVLLFAKNSYAALPIEECKKFLDEELEILCLQHSIKARIEDEIPYGSSLISYEYDKEDIEFRSNSLVSISPDGSINYDIYYGKQAYCSSEIDPCFSFSPQLQIPFMNRVIGGAILSHDDPAFTSFEMRYFIENGIAYVSLTKRKFDMNNDEIN